MQLALPLPPQPAWSPVEVERLGPRGRGRTVAVRLVLRGRAVALRLTPSEHGAELRLWAECDTPGAGRLALRVRRRPIFLAEVEADAPAPLHWGLGPAPALADERDFFGYAHRWASRALAWGDPHRARRRAVRRAVAELLADASARLAALCAPGPRAGARRFLPPARARLYGLLVRDERGWLGQAARAAPGALLLGLALADERETSEAGVRLLHELGEGRRLDAALGAALEAWAAALPAWGAWGGRRGDDAGRAFAAAARLDAAGRARLRAAQRILVRRAGPWVEPGLLLLPPPLRFAPEDVPAGPRDNARWFRVMKVARLTMPADGAAADEALLAPFAAFASRHAATLGRPPPGIDLADWLHALLARLREAGRTPSRATDPARLVASVDVAALRERPPAWRGAAPELEAAAARAAARVEAAVRAAPGTWQPPPRHIEVVHFPPWETAGGAVRVRQLGSAAELRAEGARLRHCVGGYLPQVEAGELVVCSAVVRGQRLTLALRSAGGRWQLSECAGFANREPTRAELGALGPWFEAHGVAPPGGGRR